MALAVAAPESRESTGGYTGIISQLIDLQATGTSQDASATAAVEAVAGSLSRAFASATVEAPQEIVDALDPRCLALIGRDLIRRGESLHVIRMAGDGFGWCRPAPGIGKAGAIRVIGYAPRLPTGRPAPKLGGCHGIRSCS